MEFLGQTRGTILTHATSRAGTGTAALRMSPSDAVFGPASLRMLVMLLALCGMKEVSRLKRRDFSGNAINCINHGPSHSFLRRGQPHVAPVPEARKSLVCSGVAVEVRGGQVAWPAWRLTESGNIAASSILSVFVIEVNNIEE